MLLSHPGQPVKNMGIPSLVRHWSQNSCVGRGAEIGLRRMLLQNHWACSQDWRPKIVGEMGRRRVSCQL